MTASMQTRMAQGAARDAEAEWKQHQAMRPACSRMKRDRAAEPCGPGAELRNEARTLRRDAQHEAELDRAPNPDQAVLF